MKLKAVFFALAAVLGGVALLYFLVTSALRMFEGGAAHVAIPLFAVALAVIYALLAGLYRTLRK